MPTMTAKNMMKLLEANGWYLVRTRGSHYVFNHKEFIYPITVPMHAGDLNPKTYHSIMKAAGLK